MGNEHPTYPNPTINEALCEIHFRLPQGVDWKPSMFGDFFNRVQSRFPELEPAARVGVQLQMRPDGVGQRVLPPQQRMRYKEPSGKLLLQLSSKVLSVNVLAKYPGWAQMSENILWAWRHAIELIKPEAIARIGLRYINFIERTRPDQTPGDWFAPSDYIPKSVLSSLPGFLSRLEIHTDECNRRIITLAEASSPDQDTTVLVLDIDCMVEKEIEIHGESVLEEITLLHDAVWDIFDASKTPRLEKRLQGDE